MDNSVHAQAGWQPIKTAPADLRVFLVFCPEDKNVYEVYSFAGETRLRIFASGGRWLTEKPTHWMPLPEPPNTQPTSATAERVDTEESGLQP